MMATEDMSKAAEMSVRDLEDEVATLAAHLNAGTCRWLELVGELDRRGEWYDCTCAEWLAWRCALLPRTAREHVRVARALQELPLMRAAFARGELSYSKVRALTRVADADSEEELLDLARAATASQLERLVRAYRRITDEEANDLHANAYLTTFWNGDGSLAIYGRLAPEDGAVFLRALDAARDQLWEKERGSAEPQRPTSAETLVGLSDMALAATQGRSGGERYQVLVHLDGDGGGCTLDDGPSLAPETTRRLICDCSLVAMSERNGKTLNVGRKTRTISPALRRALRARDHSCRFPGCNNRYFVDGHHIQHWTRGGMTSLDNVLLLCRRHHRLVHEGGYAVDDEMRFYDPWGRHIPPVAQPPPGDANEVLRHEHTGAIGPYSCASEGERMDLELQVEALAAVLQGRSSRSRG
jgi:hypothetical protein